MSHKLSKTTITFHWVIAIMIIGLLGTGKYMAHNDVYSMFSTHKSIGITVAILVVLRILWRIKEGWPKSENSFPLWQRFLSRLTHYVLIISTLLMPISGMVMSVMGGKGLYWFGLELIARNPNPDNIRRTIPIDKIAAENAHNAHEIISMIIIVALLLHVAGALKHHFIDKDNTLKRMLGR